MRANQFKKFFKTLKMTYGDPGTDSNLMTQKIAKNFIETA